MGGNWLSDQRSVEKTGDGIGRFKHGSLVVPAVSRRLVREVASRTFAVLKECGNAQV